jgi:hypothetical protein
MQWFCQPPNILSKNVEPKPFYWASQTSLSWFLFKTCCAICCWRCSDTLSPIHYSRIRASPSAPLSPGEEGSLETFHNQARPLHGPLMDKRETLCKWHIADWCEAMASIPHQLVFFLQHTCFNDFNTFSWASMNIQGF